MLLLKTYVMLIKGGFPGKADFSHVFLLFSKASGGAKLIFTEVHYAQLPQNC
jgi:hypothetical protein